MKRTSRNTPWPVTTLSAARTMARRYLRELARIESDEVDDAGVIASSIYYDFDNRDFYREDGDPLFNGHAPGRHESDVDWLACTACQWMHEELGTVAREIERLVVEDQVIVEAFARHIRSVLSTHRRAILRRIAT